MTSGKFLCALIAALIVSLLICTPVAAYSDDATSLYAQGQALIQTKDYARAEQAFDSAIALEPNYFEAWNAKADALNRERNFAEALAASNKSLEINPDYAKGWINRGQILYNIGYEYEDVFKDMTTANALYADQLQAFENAIAADPNNAEAWFNKGYALGGMKRYDEAIAAFNHVIQIDPSYPQIQANLKIAEGLRDKAAPSYKSYVVPVAAGAIVAVIAVAWFLVRKKK